jgi:two-component system, cell cycle response regulator CpdR
MSKRILVVDDYPAMLTLIRAVLEAYTDYSVETTHDGKSAQTIIGNNKPFDLILLDIGLPGKPNGLELAPIIRQHSPGCAIVYVTGQDLPAKLLDYRPPYTGHLKKPFHIRDLVSEVERALHLVAAEPVIGKSPESEVWTVVAT